MIHKLEDMLDVLRNPGKYEEESGSQFFVLPWKKHQVVPIYSANKPFEEIAGIPGTDDALLLRNPTEEERRSLVEKYSHALSILSMMEESFPVLDSFTTKGHLDIEAYCRKEYLFWLLMEKREHEGFEEIDYEYADQDLPF